MNKPSVQKKLLPQKTNDNKTPHTQTYSEQKQISKKVRGETKDIQRQKEFLNSLLRHDLKNKLCVITGYLELLEDANLSEEKIEYLENAKKAAMESSDLIKTIKKVFEAENESTEILEIDTVLRDVIEEREPQAKNNDMNIEYLGKSLQATGGPLLKEIFSNLIENSITHSKGTKIRVLVWSKNQETVVTIEDDGKGIPVGEKDKIKNKGFKGPDSDGSGLGMYLSNIIVETYGGRIEIKESELGGVRFDVFLKNPTSPS